MGRKETNQTNQIKSLVSKLTFLDSCGNTIRVSNGLHPDQVLVWFVALCPSEQLIRS